MVVSHNVPALFTNLSMRRADRGLQTAMQRLSSGTRINSARDDAAGLAIANKLTYQVGGLNRASDNATHGISLIQTAEGALNEVHNMLQRLRELAVQAATDTLVDENRRSIQLEVDQLIDEINSISTRTEYNRMRILNGEADRILENFNRTVNTDGILTRSIVTPTFVSTSVQPGQLRYNIASVGQHAVVNVTSDFLRPNNAGPAVTAGSNISVNGINVVLGDSWSDFQVEFSRALETAGINIQHGASGSYLYTNIAGRDQHITIEGSDSLLTALGLTAGTARGTGAIVNITGFFDINNNPLPHDNLAITARGNAVQIRGPQGEDIRFNIQVAFRAGQPAIVVPPTPATATRFVFTDGTVAPPGANAPGATISPPGFAAAPVNPIQMTMEIRNFGPIMLQIGPNHNMGMPVQIPRVNGETLGLVEFVDGTMRHMVNYRNRHGASDAITISDDAINLVSGIRSRLGAYQNRLESTVRSLDVAAENTEISRSRIQDTDMARESTIFAQYNVMFQAAMAILGQANQRPQQLVSLLQ